MGTTPKKEEKLIDNSTQVVQETLTLSKLLNNSPTIPIYQRAYEWRSDHVKNLLNDTYEAFQKEKTYLLGTAILHKTSEGLEIVDGQQRLVSLTILFQALGYTKTLSLLGGEFDTVKSAWYLRNTQREIAEFLKDKSANYAKHLAYLCDKVELTVLTVSGDNALDLAYTFFDSVNSRGKKLTDFDLLKAYHLMFIPQEQESLAHKHNDYWQSNDAKHGEVLGSTLRRIRQWSMGMDYDIRADRCDFYEFISAIEPKELEQTEHRFNRYMQPNVFRSWHRENDRVVLNMKYDPKQDSEDLLPMEIPQTLEGGDAFFLYAKRYHESYALLFEKSEECKGFQN